MREKQGRGEKTKKTKKTEEGEGEMETNKKGNE